MSIHLENCHWQCQSKAQFGLEDEIHIWKTPSLALDNNVTESFSADEKRRLNNITNATARNTFITSRYLIRQLFTSYLNIPAKKMQFAVLDKGKPYLANLTETFEYNLSHTDNIILLAVSNHYSLGIDIEPVRKIKNWKKIADKVFSIDQYSLLEQSRQPQELFISFWTKFEALQKLYGHGVFGSNKTDMDSVEIITFMPENNYQAALAFHASGEIPKIHFYEFDNAC